MLLILGKGFSNLLASNIVLVAYMSVIVDDFGGSGGCLVFYLRGGEGGTF